MLHDYPFNRNTRTGTITSSTASMQSEGQGVGVFVGGHVHLFYFNDLALQGLQVAAEGGEAVVVSAQFVVAAACGAGNFLQAGRGLAWR